MKPGRKAQPKGVLEPLVPGVQPDPPKELSPDEAIEWKRLWEVSPPDWFPKETWPLMIQLCRHICQARFMGECMQEVRQGLLSPKDVEQIRHLEYITRLHDREGRAMAAIMEKLRLTTQQRLNRNVAANKQVEQAPEVQPWLSAHDYVTPKLNQ